MTPDAADPATIWTAGHSNLDVDDFVERLRSHGIGLLTDIRTVPRSRRNPQFDVETLPATLSLVGIDHRHEKTLGGLRRPRPDSVNTALQNAGFRGYADHMQTPEFRRCVEELVGEAAIRRLCLMCAEASPWHCHRSLLCDALTLRGVEVRHILSPTQTEPHRLNPFARRGAAAPTYPGLL